MKMYFLILWSAAMVTFSSVSYAESVQTRNADSFSSGLAIFDGRDSIKPSQIDEKMLLEMREKINKVESTQQSSDRKIEEQQSKIADLNSKISELESINSDQKSSIERLKQDNDKLSHQVDNLSQKIK